MQFIGPVFIAGYGNVIHFCLQGKISEGNRIGNTGVAQPVFLFYPGIGGFLLQSVREFLFEKTQMII